MQTQQIVVVTLENDASRDKVHYTYYNLPAQNPTKHLLTLLNQTSNLDTSTQNYREHNNGPTYETLYSGPSYPISGNHSRQRLSSFCTRLHLNVSECPTLLNGYTFIPVGYALPLIEVIQHILQFIVTVLIFHNEREHQCISSTHSF